MPKARHSHPCLVQRKRPRHTVHLQLPSSSGYGFFFRQSFFLFHFVNVSEQLRTLLANHPPDRAKVASRAVDKFCLESRPKFCTYRLQPSLMWNCAPSQRSTTMILVLSPQEDLFHLGLVFHFSLSAVYLMLFATLEETNEIHIHTGRAPPHPPPSPRAPAKPAGGRRTAVRTVMTSGDISAPPRPPRCAWLGPQPTRRLV